VAFFDFIHKHPTAGCKCKTTTEEIVLNANHTMLHGILSTQMDAGLLALKPNSCQALLCFNLLENPVSFIKKKPVRNRINLELFLTLFILNYYEYKKRDSIARS